ncbi:MAG: hypothetical protein RL701_684 [Pseudomonadota bacterium]|jgi:uncharacterized cupin superfamily protein
MSHEVTAEAALDPVTVESLPWKDWRTGVRYAGRTQSLSDARATGLRIGVHIEELLPGKQSCPFHYHLLEEEHIWMLEGAVTLRLGDQRLRFAAGQFVSFPAGAERGHCMINEGTAVARYLIIGDNNPNEVCVYPDSGNIMLRGFSRTVYKHGPEVDCWDGEKKDEPL